MQLTEDELIKYSDEHLLHELNMLWQLADRMEPNKTGFHPSMLLECFALHLRNLIEFFCLRPKGNYMRASHFFDNPDDWSAKMTTTLGRAYGRASEEVDHLTTGRKSGTPPDKEWDTARLLKEIEPVARDFTKRASPKKLGPKVRELFKQPSNELRVWLGNNATYSNVAACAITSTPVSSLPSLPPSPAKKGP